MVTLVVVIEVMVKMMMVETVMMAVMVKMMVGTVMIVMVTGGDRASDGDDGRKDAVNGEVLHMKASYITAK